MRLFVSALEYSANIHLKYLLRELVKRENVELCGIFDENIIGNLSLGMQFRTCENFGESTDFSLVLSPKFSQIQKPHRKYFDCDLQSESPTKQTQIAESSLVNSANPQNLVNLNSCEAPENSPASWCKKSESKGAVVPPADFLLETEKRGSPPKSEKAELFGNTIKKSWGERGGGCSPFCEKESKLSGENGERFAESGTFSINGTSLCNIENIAVMGFIDVLKRARFFLELRKKCVNLALSADKILLMDSSSFNIPLAKRVKKRDSHKMIMYYILPQVWAWKPWRAKVIEANCDKLAAILPFEVKCYEKKAKFVGHPLLDEIQQFREINSSLGAPCEYFENLGRFADAQVQSHAPNSQKTPQLPPQILELDSGESSLRGESMDSPKQSKQNKCASAHRISPDSWCKKSESKGAVVPPADFLLESELRGTPPKSEKAAAFWRVGGAGRGVQPFLREKTSESKSKEIVGDSRITKMDSSLTAFAQNDESVVDCHESLRDSRNDESLDCFGDESPRNDDSAHDSLKSPQDNFAKIFTFMPGSRLSEINRIFPIFLQVKDELKKRDSKARFNLVVPKKFSTKNLSEIYGNLNDFHITFDAHTSILQSTFAFICSGTATLECALIGTPFVLGYKCRALEAFIAKRFLHIKFVGLANILYSHIAPNSQFHTELLQENLNAKNLLDSYLNANPNDFLCKSLELRKYLQKGSAQEVARWILDL